MTALPTSASLTGVGTTNATQKLNFAAIRDFMADLFSTDSTMATAHAAFKNYDAGTLHNLGLAATVGASALTVALKTAAGADASAASPVMIGFRSDTLT